MISLYVLRHADAEPAFSGGGDFARRLSDWGKADAEAVGREMRRRSFLPEVVIAGPARRVVDTLYAVAAELDCKMQVRFDPKLYLADVHALTAVIGGIDASFRSLLLVGHNPGLQHLVLSLARPGDLRDQVARGFPTAALAKIVFAPENWAEVRAGSGELAEFFRPGDFAID